MTYTNCSSAKTTIKMMLDSGRESEKHREKAIEDHDIKSRSTSKHRQTGGSRQSIKVISESLKNAFKEIVRLNSRFMSSFLAFFFSAHRLKFEGTFEKKEEQLSTTYLKADYRRARYLKTG